MWDPYREAVNAVLPQAIIVVDRFHIQRMANQVLDTVRKSIREQLTPKERRTLMHDRFILLKRSKDLDVHELRVLEPWLKTFKDLGTAYQFKEDFYDIWDSENKITAIERYKEWKLQIPEQLEAAFRPLTTAVSNWGGDICLLRSPDHERLYRSRQRRDQGYKPAGQGLFLRSDQSQDSVY